MTVCRFCDRRNSPGRTHCEGCGAELSGANEARSGDAESYADDSLEGRILRIFATQGKIAAIKAHREATGLGLKESKDAVESLAHKAGVAPAGGQGGCATVLLAVVATLCLFTTCVIASLGRWPW